MVWGARTVVGMGSNNAIEQAAHQLLERRAAERTDLVRAIVAAQESLKDCRAVLDAARDAQGRAPAGVKPALDMVVSAAQDAVAAAAEVAATAWKAAITGGWTAADLRSLGLTATRAPQRGVEVQRAAHAEPATVPAG